MNPAPPPLPPDLVAMLRRTAQETLARHVQTDDGRCSYCSRTWLHTDSPYPCPPARIANQFLQLIEDP